MKQKTDFYNKGVHHKKISKCWNAIAWRRLMIHRAGTAQRARGGSRLRSLWNGKTQISNDCISSDGCHRKPRFGIRKQKMSRILIQDTELQYSPETGC